MKRVTYGFDIYPTGVAQGQYGARLIGKDGGLLWSANKSYEGADAAIRAVALLKKYADKAPTRVLDSRGEVVG